MIVNRTYSSSAQNVHIPDRDHGTLHRRVLAAALSSVLVPLVSGLAVLPGAAHASTFQHQTAKQGAESRSSALSGSGQDQASTNETEKSANKAETLETVLVTGSLIPVSQIETATPTIRLDADRLQKQGFTDVYSALRAQSLATGPSIDSQTAAWGFTPGAGTISLLGLNPDFTLFLINGHPITSYPLLYRGGQNVVDVTHLPMSMIDHIDIVPGNLSSIYGSSAIAGVINIVLKERMHGFDLTVQAGSYARGGGASKQMSFVGGYGTDKLNLVYGVQLNKQNPIYKKSRPSYAYTYNSPKPEMRVGYPVYVDQYLSPSGYLVYEDPGNGCAALSDMFEGTTSRESVANMGAPLGPYGAPLGAGHYCGSPNYWSYATLLNKKETGSAYVNATYDIGESSQLYGSLLYTVSSDWIMTGSTYWVSNLDGGWYFWNKPKGRFESLTYTFSPEMWGDKKNIGWTYLTRTYNAWVGIKGVIGDTGFNYDLSYARSQQKLYSHGRQLVTDKVNDFFRENVLGPQLGTTSGYPIYAPDLSNFYKPVSPSQYRGMLGTLRRHVKTWVQDVNLQVTNTDLFELPGGSAGFAAVLKYGGQAWLAPANAQVMSGYYYALSGSGGSGKRRSWAVGAEMRLPVFDWVTVDVSSRYDKYKSADGDGGGSDVTYRLGLELRPTDTLLVRGTVATAFRAPDMAFVYAGSRTSYPQQMTDYYRCDLYGGSLAACPYFANQTIHSVARGSRALRPVTARSLTFGFVWSPTSSFDIKADYYRISIEDEVMNTSVDTLLRKEAACRAGTEDTGSSSCQEILSLVERAAFDSPLNGSVTTIFRQPFNVASEEVSGVQASINFTHELGSLGRIGFDVSYNNTLEHTYKASADSQVVYTLRQPQLPPSNLTFKTITNATLRWDIGKWNFVLHGTRYGKTPNYAAWFNGFNGEYDPYFGGAAGYIKPWVLYNGSITYHFNQDVRLSLMVNNIRNSLPPRDQTWVDDPYYNWQDFNVFGRSATLQLNWHFGG